jgi:hypothetical protein
LWLRDIKVTWRYEKVYYQAKSDNGPGSAFLLKEKNSFSVTIYENTHNTRGRCLGDCAYLKGTRKTIIAIWPRKYRCAIADGLYACVSKNDVRRMVNNPGDEVELKMVEEVKAYFLIPGTIVQVTEEDPSSGLSKIRMAGITVDLWTLTRFLSKHAVKDTYGVMQTPETSGLIPSATPAVDAGLMTVPDFGYFPGMSPTQR